MYGNCQEITASVPNAHCKARNYNNQIKRKKKKTMKIVNICEKK